ncbi:MAG TPA: hypothetical protein VFV81_05070 [Verrucomicrobiae bacterium]|nr:hypothetical protein [Verrucomicrobiae bacterium]
MTSLKGSIQSQHHCRAHHRTTVLVQVPIGGTGLRWEGYVEVYDLSGHPVATVGYAWSNFEPGEATMIAVLGSEAVDSAEKAVRSMIFGGRPSSSSSPRPPLKRESRVAGRFPSAGDGNAWVVFPPALP